jgi:hypothetical protein
VFPVLISIANYATLAFLDAAFWCLLPLFLSTPIEYGGLGFTPFQIGRYLSVIGLSVGVLQAVVMPLLIRRFSPKRVFVTGMMMFIPAYSLFPLANALARSSGGVGPAVWAVLACQLVCNLTMGISYGASVVSPEYGLIFVRLISIYFLFVLRRLCVYLYHDGGTEHAVARRDERPVADDGVDFARGGQDHGGLVVCLFC